MREKHQPSGTFPAAFPAKKQGQFSTISHTIQRAMLHPYGRYEPTNVETHTNLPSGDSEPSLSKKQK